MQEIPLIGKRIMYEGRAPKQEESFHRKSQITADPTHILQNTSACINLIFTNQLNFMIDSGVHLSLHPNCHHQIVFSKLNLQIEYLPSIRIVSMEL